VVISSLIFAGLVHSKGFSCIKGGYVHILLVLSLSMFSVQVLAYAKRNITKNTAVIVLQF